MLLQVIGFRLPTMVNEYEIFRLDIAPVGFDLVHIRIPESFQFSDFMARGAAVMEVCKRMNERDVCMYDGEAFQSGRCLAMC